MTALLSFTMFDTAIGSLGRFAFARRALLRRIKAAALDRTSDLAAPVIHPLSAVELDELRDLVGAADAE